MLQLLPSGGLGAVVEDPSPVLGGDLDGGGKNISNVLTGTFTNLVVGTNLIVTDAANKRVRMGGSAGLQLLNLLVTTAVIGALDLNCPNLAGANVINMRAPLSTNSVSGKAFSVVPVGKSYSTVIFYTDAKLGFGSGNASRDTFMGRSAANTIRIGGAWNFTGIGNLIVNSALTAGTIQADNGFSGSWVNNEGKTVTVVGGVITGVAV